jgi:hypothetical protein
MRWRTLCAHYEPHWLQASLGVRLRGRAKVGQKYRCYMAYTPRLMKLVPGHESHECHQAMVTTPFVYSTLVVAVNTLPVSVVAHLSAQACVLLPSLVRAGATTCSR